MFFKSSNSDSNSLTTKLREGQWRLEWKNDGVDYKKLLLDFQNGQIQGTQLNNKTDLREVYKVEYEGRDFVIKHDTEMEKLLEKKIWIRLAGTLFSRLISLTTKAIKKGCPVAQELFLVAEKLSGPFCQESYIIAEFIQGQCFMKEIIKIDGETKFVYQRPDAYVNSIVDSLTILHKFGLASDDIELSNMILTKDNIVRFIDLHPRGPIFLCQASDILKMKTFYNIDMKSNNIFINVLTKIRYWHYLLKRKIRMWRKKFHPDTRVIWDDKE
jgi:serine/threonine protein kinase